LHTVGLLNGMTADFCRLDMAPWLRGEPDLQPSGINRVVFDALPTSR
jgi:hypothetical protein